MFPYRIAMPWIVIAAFCTCLQTARANDDPYPFLTSTADTIATAMAKWRTGEMELEYQSTGYGFDKISNHSYTQTTTVSGRVVWNDESRYADYQFLDEVEYPASKGKSNQVASPFNGQNEVINTPKFYSVYVKDNLSCLYQSIQLDQLGRERFNFAFDPRLTWCNYLPPFDMAGHVYSLSQRTDKEKTTVTSLNLHPRRKQILRDDGTGFITGFVVDLDQGGMIIECWIHPPLSAKNDWTTATWDWAKDPHGVWYATKWTNVKHEPKDREKVTFRQEAIIKGFNSQPKIPANRFEFSSLKLAKGTRVVKVTKEGTSYSNVGGPPPKKGVDLDGLVNDAKAGFAAPTEEKPE